MSDALHPAQNVGMALHHAQNAADFLQAAAAQRAVILPRAVVERAIRRAEEIREGGDTEAAAREIVDTLSFYVDT